MPSNKSSVDRVTLAFDLHQLPAAEHKAGLAGLVLQIRDMYERHAETGRPAADELPELGEVSPHSATVTLTEQSCRALFDDLYMAKLEEAHVKSKWSGAKLLRTDQKSETDSETGRTKQTTVYVYEVVAPRNPFLMKHLNDETWQKLWRDMLWQIPRSKPTTRRPYNERAAGQPCSEGGKMWSELVRWEKDRRKNHTRTTSVSSSLLLGAQDINAEQVPFEVQSDHLLLLHCWTLAVLIYVPWQLKLDQADPSRSRDEPVGYTLAIPEVSNLEKFCDRYLSVLRDLGSRPEKRGYRPRAACIDLPAQSALEFLEYQAWVAAGQVGEVTLLRHMFHAVEYRHLAKFGNNVKLLGSGRIVPDESLMEGYRNITGKTGFQNPLFRSTMLAGLLNRSVSHWYEPFTRLLETLPCEFFVRSDQTPRLMRNFPQDVRMLFRQLGSHAFDSDAQEIPMNDDCPPDDQLATLILRMVRNYIHRKAEDRSGIRFDSFRNVKVKDEHSGKERMDVPKPYREAQEKVATKIFLEVRSRHHQEFTQYFADCFGSVAQRIGSEDDFQLITQAILTRPADVRTMTLLAISACS